ncbi:MAG TPA: hemerythrin domain-containing protein [Chloroflexota bacterium]|nr:hemerythrin domain-containing protein [Chloroflexota bacterium]
MDAIQFLLEEHQKVKARFAEIEQAPSQQRGELWRRLEPELKIHEAIEDTYLYGPLSKDPAARGGRLATFEQEQDEDVRQLEPKLMQLSRLDPADDAWLTQLREIRDTLAEHIREEETEILPGVSQVWDREKLQMAGRQMAEAKQEAMTNPTRYASVMSERGPESRTGMQEG